MTQYGGPLNTLVLMHLRRIHLRRVARRLIDEHPADVSVVIGCRNRGGARLRRTLESIRSQSFPAHRISPVLVDYGSQPSSARELRHLARAFSAELLRVPAPAWNRAHCLNAAIRRCTTTFVFCMDADILLPSGYIDAVVQTLQQDPLRVVYPRVLDLPESSERVVNGLRASTSGQAWTALRRMAEPRFASRLAYGLPFTLPYFLRRIRGFDEEYKLWGLEDDDLFERLRSLGLDVLALPPELDVVHQHHPKYEGVASMPNFDAVVEGNRERFSTVHTLLRNDRAWGAI